MSRMLTVIAVLMALATGARAESVDWSQYIDKNPSQPIASSSKAQPEAVEAKPAKSATRSTKVASKSKTKARTKTKARHK